MSRSVILCFAAFLVLASGNCADADRSSPPTSSAATPSGDGPPSCLLDNVEEQPRPDPVIPAPIVSPARGGPGTSVTISGSGFAPRAGVLIIAFYGSDDCAMPGDGRGDHLLAIGSAGQTGTYELVVEWPQRFDPVEGRDLPADGLPLPVGRYWLIALPCPSLDRSCFHDFNVGSRIGGPFTLTSR